MHAWHMVPKIKQKFHPPKLIPFDVKARNGIEDILLATHTQKRYFLMSADYYIAVCMECVSHVS